MVRKSKRFREIAKLADFGVPHPLSQAIEILKKCPPVRFDQSVDVALKTGVDTRKSDQQVRGTVPLPNGTGKKVVIVVLARADKVQEALQEGADYAGGDELVEKIRNGWVDFDAVIATPDMMKGVGTLGKVLGPRGLMPSPKAGTVTTDVVKAVREVRAGRVEFKVDKHGVIGCRIGSLSFSVEKLVENFQALFSAVLRAKPVSAKGIYLQSVYISSTMGPGIKLDLTGLSSSEA